MLSNLRVWLNWELLPLKWGGLKRGEEAVWCHLSFQGSHNIRQLKIQNELLVRRIAEQVNIIRLHLNGEKKFFNLDRQIRYEEVLY